MPDSRLSAYGCYVEPSWGVPKSFHSPPWQPPALTLGPRPTEDSCCRLTLPLAEEGGSTELVSWYLFLASHVFCTVLRVVRMPGKKTELPSGAGKQRQQGIRDFSLAFSHHL